MDPATLQLLARALGLLELPFSTRGPKLHELQRDLASLQNAQLGRDSEQDTALTAVLHRVSTIERRMRVLEEWLTEVQDSAGVVDQGYSEARALIDDLRFDVDVVRARIEGLSGS